MACGKTRLLLLLCPPIGVPHILPAGMPVYKRQLSARPPACLQSARAPSATSGNPNTDPGYHPLWAAGITGTNQTVGCGDSGVGASAGIARRCLPARCAWSSPDAAR